MRKMYLAVGLLATLLTAGMVFGLTLLSSKHLSGTSEPERILTLTGNMTGITTYIGDTFLLTANLTGLTDRYITFYCNTLPIGGVTSTGGIATISYYCTVASWDFYATAEY